MHAQRLILLPAPAPVSAAARPGKRLRPVLPVALLAVMLTILLHFALATPALAAAPKAGELWREPTTGMEFAWVPGGCFDMGCGPWTQDCELYEYPVHKVCLDGFWLGRFEVTQGQWVRVMGSNPAYNRADGQGELPVELVSWHEARVFAAKLSSLGSAKFRLPSEAEWEFAARGGGRAESFPGGVHQDAAGWHYDISGETSHPVGGRAANSLGLFDMSGNVFEWCEDVFDRGFYARSPENNPLCTDPGQTPADWRVRRGGSFGNLARDTRTAMRGKMEPDRRDEFTGLRLLRAADGK